MNTAEYSWRELLWARLLVGVIVFVCAEVFSGASVIVGLWNPLTWVLTYWLYFAHFFFLTTLAVRTGRTSLTSLYLWGLLFGLYESWITKVIWNGYDGDGRLILGAIGPFGYSEISMVVLFHPVMSFILPIAVTCVLCPPLRRLFPDLAWFTGKSKIARLVQIYLILSLAPVMAINSGGTINLAANLALAIILLLVLARLARRVLTASDSRSVVVFGRKGFAGLCVYLALLYGVTYPALRPEGLPSFSVQLLTLTFYAVAITGLYMHGRREPVPEGLAPTETRELRLLKRLFVVLILAALALSTVPSTSVLVPGVALNFILWTPLGFALSLLAVAAGMRRRPEFSPA